MSHGIGVPKTQGPIPPNATSLLGIPRLLLYYPESYTSLCKVLGNWTVGTGCKIHFYYVLVLLTSSDVWIPQTSY